MRESKQSYQKTGGKKISLMEKILLKRKSDSVLASFTKDYDLVCYLNKENQSIIIYHVSSYFHKLFGEYFSERVISTRDFENFISEILSEVYIQTAIVRNTQKEIFDQVEQNGYYYKRIQIKLEGNLVYYDFKYALDEKNHDCIIFGLQNVDQFVKRQIEEIEKEHRSGEAFRQLLMNIPGLAFTKDVETNLYLDCNQEYASYAGKKSPSEVYGKSDTELFSPELAEQFYLSDREALSYEQPYILTESVLNSDGKLCHFQTIKFKFLNAQGRLCLLGMCIDITETVELQKKLEQTQEIRINNIISGLATEYTALYYLNLPTDEYQVYSISDRLADTQIQMQKYHKFTELYKWMLRTVIHPDDVDKFKEYADLEVIKERLSKKKKLSLLFRRKYEEEYLWTEMVFIKFADEEDEPVDIAVGFIEKDKEIKIQKMHQEELEQQHEALEQALKMAHSSNRAKTVFLNNMSHDIRTPMNAVIGFTNLAVSHIDEKELILDYLGKIQKASNYLLEIINDVLDMSRIESGKMTLSYDDENLFEIIEAIKSIIQNDLKTKQLSFTIKENKVKNENIVCDRLRLKQVLLNVISNAIKYTPEKGEIKFTITEKKSDIPDVASFEFVVKDNGIGMSKEFLETIYEPFTRASTSTVSHIQGTGLGMSITKEIVEKMRGSITVKSKENVGTEVIIMFNFVISKMPVIKEQAERQDVTAYGRVNFKDKKILLVEDNKLNQEIAEEILISLGFIVTIAEDGTEAVEIMKNSKEKQFDLILMDIQMPVMDGYEATKQIRKMDKAISEIPILAMTANAFEEDRKLAIESGMNDHISKPIDVSNLKQVLGKFVK